MQNRSCFSKILSRFLFAFIAFFSSMPLAQAQANQAVTEKAFQDWLTKDLWKQAQAAGVSATTFNKAFAGVKINWQLPDLVVPGSKPTTPKKQTQAEFGVPANYFNAKTIQQLTKGGQARLQQYASVLGAIEQQYGVPKHILLAVWGRESGFGGVKIPYNAFEVLGTKAFMATRKDMFRKELIAALQIVEHGFIDGRSMKSSWAGALGQPQFMPTSYLQHAVDFDGDGKRDIWNSVADTLGSIANYLHHSGWQRGRDWGFEVDVPAVLSCTLEGPDQGKTIAEWVRLGVKRVNGKAFPTHELEGQGFLLMPAGRHGPAFIVTPNFYVLKAYNMSDLYALFIGHVGDRIAFGANDFKKSWGAVGHMYRSDVAVMQKKLQHHGYDIGNPDGLAGFKTRRSIGLWQSKAGLQSTCFPDHALLEQMR